MDHPIKRRAFLSKTLQGIALAGLTDCGLVANLQPALSRISQVPDNKVRLSSDIEPLVRLIEDTPRERLMGEIGSRVRQNLSHEDALAALFLAGVRDIEPRPVGFKFHAVMVVYATDVSSQAADEKDYWLPIFWALDNFKVSQAKDQAEGGWCMKQVDETRLPSGNAAQQRFKEAMDNWREEEADFAITGLVRDAGAHQISELLWRYCARDFRDIGHKAIYTANALRTLQRIGWRHAEPVSRSLAYALLAHEGANPAERDAEADRPWRQNLERVSKIRAGWSTGKISPEKVKDLLVLLRQGSFAESCDAVVQSLNQEIDPATVWDALFLQAGELLMRKPGIVGVHCVTSMNALHYGFQTSGDDETRRLLLLQAAAFLPMFRAMMGLNGAGNADQQIDTFEATNLKSTGTDSTDQIFTDVSKDPMQACRQTLAFLNAHGQPEAITKAARRLIFQKGDDSHDYKFSTAAFEDYYHITPHWRDRYLAASMFYLRGTQEPDNELIRRTREALG